MDDLAERSAVLRFPVRLDRPLAMGVQQASTTLALDCSGPLESLVVFQASAPTDALQDPSRVRSAAIRIARPKIQRQPN